MIMRLQHQVSEEVATNFARAIVAERLRNARRLLQRGQREQGLDLADKIKALEWTLRGLTRCAKSIKSIRGYEGNGYQAYRLGWHQMCRYSFQFEGTDPAAAFISIHQEVENALGSKAIEICSEAGLDPFFGLYHGSRSYGFPAMARDLIHAYTPPLVDALVLRLINRRQITLKDFEHEGRKTSKHIAQIVEVAIDKRLSESLVYRTNFMEEGERCTYREALQRQAKAVIELLQGREFKVFIVK